MDPIRDAIVARLKATGAVTSLLGDTTNIFHRVAPRGARPPFVVLNRQSSTDDHAFAGRALERERWTIKAIGRGSDSGPADDIAAAIRTALEDAALTIAGYRLLYLRRESKLDYGEVDDGESWHHVGAIWRLDADPL